MQHFGGILDDSVCSENGDNPAGIISKMITKHASLVKLQNNHCLYILDVTLRHVEI